MATTEIKERPILFSGPMVRAILGGRKTQTRRVIKDLADISNEHFGMDFIKCENGVAEFVGMLPAWFHCPYGKPGDRLWVRETHRLEDVTENGEGFLNRYSKIHYRADIDSNQKFINSLIPQWKPSIFMPRWASRITLEVTEVRVERINQITTQDIEAEGTPINPMEQKSYRHDAYQRLCDFRFLWNNINEKRGFDWRANPWVWVVEFKKV